MAFGSGLLLLFLIISIIGIVYIGYIYQKNSTILPCLPGQSGLTCSSINCNTGTANVSDRTTSGSCTCLPGTAGSNCQYTNESACGHGIVKGSGTNTGDGTCETCSTGWVKDPLGKCSLCDVSNGYGGSTCRSNYCGNGTSTSSIPVDTATCNCSTGWSLDSNGKCTLCDHTHNYGGMTCSANYCEQGSPSSSTPGAPCVCATGWSLDANGKCTVCDHTHNYGGTSCTSNFCGAHGLPSSSTPGSSCSCSVGWINDGGICNACDYTHNYGGLTCSENYCGSHGLPSSSTPGSGCTCSLGWKDDGLGGKCNVCSLGWKDDGLGGKCNVCDNTNGFGGPNCSENYCGSNSKPQSSNPDTNSCSCLTQGWIKNISTGLCDTCYASAGYGGTNCTANYCGTGGLPSTNPLVTTCTCLLGWAKDNNGKCNVCATGWKDDGLGGKCNVCDNTNGYGGPNCSANYCGSHGTPVSNPSGTCTCVTGWKDDGVGGKCNVCNHTDSYKYGGPNCSANYCGVHGTPVSNPNGSCTCATGWKDDGVGGRCNVCDNTDSNKYGGPNCIANYCGSHGTPVSNPNGSCTCSTGWTGQTCSLCGSNYWIDSNGNCSLCSPGYYGSTCTSSSRTYCVNGTSISGTNPSSTNPVCTCDVGWAKDGSGKCTVCASGYSGTGCKTLTCANGGTVDSSVTTGTGSCLCPPGYDPATKCTTCLNTGYDVATGCKTCLTGRSGKDCQIVNCNTGTADVTDVTSNSGTCTCLFGYTGTRCESCLAGRSGKGCLVNTCSNVGTAVVSDTTSESGTCTCSGMYDPATKCSTCLAGLEITSGCTTCPLNRSGAGCPVLSCSNGGIADTSITTGTGKCICPSGYDTTKNCSTCLNRNYEPSTNCSTCLAGLEITSGCSTCTLNRSGAGCPVLSCSNGGIADTSITTGTGKCICPSGYDATTNCSTCKPGFDIATNCTTCNPRFDINYNCTRCMAGLTAKNCSRMCANGGTVDTTDIYSEAGTCICRGGYVPETSCTVCFYKYDATKDCQQCLPGTTGARCEYTCNSLGTADTTVITGTGKCTCNNSNIDPATNCKTCIAGKTGPDCQYSPVCYNGGTPNISDIFGSFQGSCSCVGGYNPSTNCQTCLPGYDPATNCQECKANYDINYKCSRCIPGKSGAGCQFSPVCNQGTINTTEDYTPAGTCNCENHYINSASGYCNICERGYDISTNCQTCLPGYDNNSWNCSTCIEGRTGEGCQYQCYNGGIAITGALAGTGACECIGNYNPSTNCQTCLSNYDPSTNCQTCLPGYDINYQCTRCLAGRSGAGCNSKTCFIGGTVNTTDITSETGSCTCIGNFDPATECQTCKVGWANDGLGGLCNVCDSANGYGGANCPRVCGIGGGQTTHINTLGVYSCQCKTGWALSEYISNYRQRTCTSCNIGYAGPNCTDAATYCVHGTTNEINGRCICSPGWDNNPNDSGKCTSCLSGWSMVNGTCVPTGACTNGTYDAATGVCTCKAGWVNDGYGGICNVCAPFDRATRYAGPNCEVNWCSLYLNNSARASTNNPNAPYCICASGTTVQNGNLASGRCY